ncbi:MAG: Gldg family protein [Clostridia bacterium]|nr:Gldg family protein [Clostridia bacterium]
MNEKKNRYQNRNRTVTLWLAAILVVLAIVIAINAALSALPIDAKQHNLAQINEYELSAKSKDWLKTLETDVTLYLVCTGGEAAVDRDLYGFLEEYTKTGEHIKLQLVDPRLDEGLIVSFGGAWPSDNSVIVSSEKRYRILTNEALYSYYNELMGTTFSLEEYNELQDAFWEMDSTGEMASSFADSTATQFDGESRVTNAINFVSLDKTAKVYMLSANGTASLPSAMQNLLLQSGFELHTLTSLAEIPNECDLLMMYAPSVDLSDLEKNGLEGYLSRGGQLFLTTYYLKNNLPNLAAVLETYGMSVEGDQADYVCDGNPDYYLQGTNSTHALFNAHIKSQHPATGSFSDSFVVYQAHAIQFAPVEGVTQTNWLYTSDGGYLKEYNADSKSYIDGAKGEYTVGAIAQKGDSRILWLASPQMLDSTYNQLSEGGNYTLAITAMNYMTGTGTNSITIPSTAIDQPVLTLNATQFTVTTALIVIILPFGTMIAGIVIFIARKRR